MVVSEKTRRALKEFGLTEYEAKAYVSLVESGALAASELGRIASIPYSKMSGIMSTTGEEGRPPIRVSVPVADIAAGHYASTAILACLSRRLVTGRGEYIDIALYDSIVSWLTYLASYYFAT